LRTTFSKARIIRVCLFESLDFAAHDSDRNILRLLAPVQGVTMLEFLLVIVRCGGPDVYWTEEFRVHAVSHLENGVVRIAGLEPAHLAALPPQSSVSANSTICATVLQ
jgi:hypothetical protein